MLTCWKPVLFQGSSEKKKQPSTTATSVGNSCQACDKCVGESPVSMQCSVSQVCLQHLTCLHLTDLTEVLIKLDSLGLEIRQAIGQVFNRSFQLGGASLLSATIWNTTWTRMHLSNLKALKWSNKIRLFKTAFSFLSLMLIFQLLELPSFIFNKVLHLGEMLCSNKLHLSHLWVLAIQWTCWHAVRCCLPFISAPTQILATNNGSC